jgi:hypothetical protein
MLLTPLRPSATPAKLALSARTMAPPEQQQRLHVSQAITVLMLLVKLRLLVQSAHIRQLKEQQLAMPALEARTATRRDRLRPRNAPLDTTVMAGPRTRQLGRALTPTTSAVQGTTALQAAQARPRVPPALTAKVKARPP